MPERRLYWTGEFWSQWDGHEWRPADPPTPPPPATGSETSSAPARRRKAVLVVAALIAAVIGGAAGAGIALAANNNPLSSGDLSAAPPAQASEKTTSPAKPAPPPADAAADIPEGDPEPELTTVTFTANFADYIEVTTPYGIETRYPSGEPWSEAWPFPSGSRVSVYAANEIKAPYSGGTVYCAIKIGSTVLDKQRGASGPGVAKTNCTITVP